jgi:glycosyltransferase involved in cell wall biosynthesis
VRLLFVKESLAWPRSSGHDVHASSMMRALGDLGHETALLALEMPSAESVRGLGLSHVRTLGGAAHPAADGLPLRLTRFQEKFRSYWGVPPERIRAVASFARRWRADAVVAAGLGVLPYLAGVRDAARVWYAADEWAWHHLSQVRGINAQALDDIKQAVVKGLYERAYAGAIDRAWVVSEEDAFFMRHVAGVRRVDVVPNGVDADHYAPIADVGEVPNSCTFWGRLDFGPNVQALEWFCGNVWPEVRGRVPDAGFTVYGFKPTPAVERLAELPGVTLVPDRPDLRADVQRHQVVVLPFVSGGGVKNKLLEAAAMARPVAASRRVLNGLRLESPPPFECNRTPTDWVNSLAGLWADPDRRARLGRDARVWVTARHSWRAAARLALAGLDRPAAVV